MARNLNAAFESFAIDHNGPTGSAIITFKISQHVGKEAYYVTLITTPVNAEEDGISGMLGRAHKGLAEEFRHMADHLDEMGDYYSGRRDDGTQLPKP